jgi:hypothetical protein
VRPFLGVVGVLLFVAPLSAVAQDSSGVKLDDRVAEVSAVGVANNGRLLWSGGLRMKSKGVGGPYSVRVRVSNDDLGFAETVTIRNVTENGVSFGGPFFVNGVQRVCGPLKKRVADGDSVALDVAVEVLESGTTPFAAARSDLGQRVSGSKFVGGFASDSANDNPFDRGTTTLSLKRPVSQPDRFSLMIVDDPASGRRQATFVFAGSWPKSVSLGGDWRRQQFFFLQQMGAIEVSCD